MARIRKNGHKKNEDDAIWQYFMDHAYPKGVGYIITFPIKDRWQWRDRIYARMNGVWRNEERTLEEKMQRQMTEYKNTKYYLDNMNRTSSHILTKGSLYEKIVLWVYQKARKEVTRIGSSSRYTSHSEIKPHDPV